MTGENWTSLQYLRKVYVTLAYSLRISTVVTWLNLKNLWYCENRLKYISINYMYAKCLIKEDCCIVSQISVTSLFPVPLTKRLGYLILLYSITCSVYRIHIQIKLTVVVVLLLENPSILHIHTCNLDIIMHIRYLCKV